MVLAHARAAAAPKRLCRALRQSKNAPLATRHPAIWLLTRFVPLDGGIRATVPAVSWMLAGDLLHPLCGAAWISDTPRLLGVQRLSFRDGWSNYFHFGVLLVS
ncbi:hypothetical protein SAMN07250955_108120 [Arboricoccus pini]|uniref:Uncharacterized protein n=1 Tax=Arboricoccus pini TaxID=1963835 RepID=A0A212RGQ9_9PROT|nr:hypothetical protein SAMN07250955_108120 [Arboricoccus pini]